MAAFLVVNSVLWVAADRDGFDYFATDTWTHWDSFHYLAIAEDGYEYTPCTSLELYDVGSVITRVQLFFGMDDVELEDVCGNTGWFPGYPALISVAARGGLSAAGAGVALSVVFELATLYALWILFLRQRPRAVALSGLVAAAFFFGHVYYRAVFPMSLTTFLLLVHLHLMRTRRWAAAGGVAAAAAFTYPTAWLLGPVGAAWLWFATTDLARRQRLRAVLMTAAPPLLSFGAVIVIQWLYTGVPGAFFEHQARFGYGPSLPTERLSDVIAPLVREGVTMATVPNLQVAFVALLVVTLGAVAAFRWKVLSTTERWVALALVAFWLFPLTLGGKTSLYRIDSVLLPGVILLARLPVRVQAVVALAGVAFSYPMALLFFRGVLI